MRKKEETRLEQEGADAEYVEAFLKRLREKHPEWESCREFRRKDPPGMVRLVFPCPNAAMPDQLVMEVWGEVTVYWPNTNHTHFDWDQEGDFDQAFELVEGLFAEEVVVGIERDPKTRRWLGSAFLRTEDRLTAAWDEDCLWEVWSWRGTYDEGR